MKINHKIHERHEKTIKPFRVFSVFRGKVSNESRNAIIRKAITFWLSYSNKNKWSDEILNFQGVEDFPAFENNRDDLSLPKEDPLHEISTRYLG